MRLLKWNLCTTFAAIGAAIAYAFLFFMLGFAWQLVPAAIAGLLAAYFVSTASGELARTTQMGRYRFAGVIASVGLAWCTLFAGSLAIALTVFATAIIDGLWQAPSGQPAFNVLQEIAPGHAKDLLMTPLVAGMWFGLLPAAVLGSIFGIVLGWRSDKALPVQASTRKQVRIAAAITLLFPFLLAAALIDVPLGNSDTAEYYARTPIAIRSCGESSWNQGVVASCSGAPCENGDCDWDVEIKAFTLHVRPPAEGTWRWVGGGIGTTDRPDIIRHNVYWAQFEPDDSLNDDSPRRYASYDLVIDGENVRIGESVFRFEPGMQLDVRFLQDWSVTALNVEGAGSK